MSDDLEKEKGQRILSAFMDACSAEKDLPLPTVVEVLITCLGSSILQIDTEEHRLMAVNYINDQLTQILKIEEFRVKDEQK